MGDAAMILQEEDVRRIGDYVKPWIRDLVSDLVGPRVSPIDTQLLERMVRVEEELKAQREIMAERFDAMDRRFEAVDQRFVDLRAYSDARFEAVDRRFETMDKRFDDVQTNLSRIQWLIGTGFVLITAAIAVFGFLR